MAEVHLLAVVLIDKEESVFRIGAEGNESEVLEATLKVKILSLNSAPP